MLFTRVNEPRVVRLLTWVFELWSLAYLYSLKWLSRCVGVDAIMQECAIFIYFTAHLQYVLIFSWLLHSNHLFVFPIVTCDTTWEFLPTELMLLSGNGIQLWLLVVASEHNQVAPLLRLPKVFLQELACWFITRNLLKCWQRSKMPTQQWCPVISFGMIGLLLSCF